MEDSFLTDRGGGRFWDVSSAVHLLCSLISISVPWWLSWLKSLPAMRETQVQSLGWEDLEKEMTAHASILA